MPESTPQLFGNSWKTSSSCGPDHDNSPVDPCDVHLQAGRFADYYKFDVMDGHDIWQMCNLLYDDFPFFPLGFNPEYTYLEQCLTCQ